MKKELTEEEKEVLEAILKAHNLFVALSGNRNLAEWCDNLHKLQDIIGLRLLRRIHPEIYK
jgi:hypothetical protein